jgi:predicted transcriptional regulator
MPSHPERALLVSLRPRFATLLLSGEKTVELRRRPPDVHRGSLVLMYESSPTRRLVGRGRVQAIDVGTPAEIWREHGVATGVTREEFDAYYEGTARAVAIIMADTRPFARPASLDELRRRWADFRPPQSFRYLNPAQVARLTLPEPARTRDARVAAARLTSRRNQGPGGGAAAPRRETVEDCPSPATPLSATLHESVLSAAPR